MAEIKPYLEKMVARFDDPKVQTALKGFSKTLLFTFTDTKENWVIRTLDGTSATLVQETPEKPDVTITTTTDVMAGIMDKKVNGMTAYMQRKIQTKGAMEDMMKLQKIMG